MEVGGGFRVARVARGRAKPLRLMLLLINEPLASDVLFLISCETERRRSRRSLIDEHRHHCRRRRRGTLKSAAELAANCCCGRAPARLTELGEQEAHGKKIRSRKEANRLHGAVHCCCCFLKHHGSSRGMIGSDTTTECSMGARLSAVRVKTFSALVELLH